MSAYIEAMFSQVGSPEEDQPVLRFLWRNNPTDKVEVYQYVRHIFGAKCSPTCANFAVKKTAQDKKDSFPLEAEAAVRNFCRYDLFKCVPSLLEACNLQAGLVMLLSLVEFNLTKWISLDKYFLNAVIEKKRAQPVQSIGDGDTLPTERALGVTGDVQNFHFSDQTKGTSSHLEERILCRCLLPVCVSWWLGTVRICSSQDSRRTC